MIRYLTSDPNFNKPPTIFVQRIETPFGSFDKLTIDERERIQAVRLNDLREIQTLSVRSLIPIGILSFVIGYFISGRFLKRIDKLTQKIDRLKTNDLGKTMAVEVDDEVGRLIGSFNDLSARLKQSFEAQEQFVQNASHELKTPLTIIQTNLDTVLEDETATKEDYKEATQAALKGMKSVRKLTNNLLELTLPQNKQMQKTLIDNLIKKQIETLKPYAKELNVKVDLNIQTTDLYVDAITTSLERAIFNIIENAIKYSSQTKDPKVNVVVTGDKVNVIITIEDNGPGIPKEHQAKIFERFYRVDKSRSRQTGGFGLGLSIARTIIDDHNGKIELKSEPGRTIFQIMLPKDKT